MNYWWVNQNQTYKHKLDFLWSPKTRSDGAKNHFYDNMTEVLAGDLVFAYAGTYIRAVGQATGGAVESAIPPEFVSSENSWANVGWKVSVNFVEFASPVRPMDHMDMLKPLHPSVYSPIRKNGHGLQSVYLANVSNEFGQALIDLLDGQVESAVASLGQVDQEVLEGQSVASDLANDSTIPDQTTRTHLANARVGQGLFRQTVLATEKRCRVTGVSDPSLLRASHIKPWRDSSNKERLDRFNRLALAPHIDHLFDRYLISFTDTGRLLVSSRISAVVLDSWNISSGMMTGPFTPEQRAYMKHHRDRFKR